MKVLDAWRLSRLPYKEVVYRSIAEEKGRMWWGGFGRGRSGVDQENDFELTKKALRISKWDKLLVAIFNILAAIFPFTAHFFGSPILGLTSAIALSLAVTFGFTALYAIQTLSSFINNDSSRVLATLPIDQNHYSLITLFSFVRSVDYLVLGSIISQVILVAYYTVSPIAVFIMFSASIVNEILAVATALWFSRIFSKNSSRGDRSRTSSILRIVFILMWGSLLLGVSFLITLPYYIVPSLELFINSSQLSNVFLYLFLPFSTGITITNIGYQITSSISMLMAVISLIGYLIIGGFAGKWMIKTVKQISHGDTVNRSSLKANDFSVKIRKPLFGYILKDLKISSRNPATAFFFALPVLETIIILFLSANINVLRASTLLVSTFMGGLFVLLIPLALLNSEGTGLEYTKTLPLDINRIIISKTLLSAMTYLPVPIILFVLSFLKPITSPITLFIPTFVLLSIISASIFEIQLFLNSVTKGRISALIHDFKKLIIGITTLLFPIGVYSIIYLISFSHVIAISSLIGTNFAELSIALFLLKQNKK
jgi:predicted permease